MLKCLFLAIFAALAVSVAFGDSSFEVAPSDSTGALPLPRTAIESLSKMANENDSSVWLLVPSNVNLTEFDLNSSDLSLFKLDVSSLKRISNSDGGGDMPEVFGASPQNRRQSRKINFLRNVMKPKMSPLYLVNGTVCRFVNSQPICTTLSTTGLFRGVTPQMLNNNQQNQGGYFQNLLPNQQQQQNQNQLNQLGQLQQNQQNLQNQQVRNQQQQQQQFGPNNQGGSPFRTAALMDDELHNVSASGESIAAGNATVASATEMSVKGVGGAKSTTSPFRPQPIQQQAAAAARPLSFVVRRPAVSFLAFGRPW